MSFALGIIARSTIVLLFTATVSAVLHRGSASARHAVWAAGLLSAILVLPASAAFPALDLPLLSQSAVQPAEWPAATTDARIPSMPIDHIESGSGFVSDLAVKPVRRPIFATDRQWSWLYGLALAWAVGFTVVLRRLLLGLWSVHRLTQNSSEIREESWQSLLDRLRSELFVTRPVRLAIGGASAPMTWGVFRDVILVPSAAVEWPEERRRVVLAHELAHVKRRDGFIQLLAQIVCAVYWFNPLVWYAVARLRAERERACDDQVLNLGANAHDYATHLIQVARASSRAVGLAHTTISMAHSSQLETRLRAILDTGKRRQVLSGFGAAALFGTAAVLTLLSATLHLTAMPLPPVIPTAGMLPDVGLRTFVTSTFSKAQQSIQIIPAQKEFISGPVEKKVLDDAEIAYSVPGGVFYVAPQVEATSKAQEITNKALKMWLEEDVVYIITDEEKNTFKALGTDAEREQFIEQFWQRRDPTPGTAENEFKEEHYDRIEYVNRRFGWTKPGWTTDRGRIYILYGKPDSIDDHPSGGNYQRPVEAGGGATNTYPFQIWTYRYIEGIGNNVVLEFVDSGLQGEYRLTVDPKMKERLIRPIAFSLPHVQSAQIPFEAASISYTLDQVYTQLDKASKTFDSIESDLEHMVVNAIVPDDKDIKSGKFSYARVGNVPRVLLEFSRPASEIMLIDKDLLQIYDPKLKRVQQSSVAQHRDTVELIMATGFGQSSDAMKKQYEVTLVGEDPIDGQKTIVLDLKPRKPSSSIKMIRLWIDEQRWVTVQNRFTEPSGDYSISKFTNIKLNGSIPDSRFKLDLPKDVTIVRM